LSFSAISAGGLHTCGIAQNWIYCWGAAEETTWVGPDSLTPVKVYGLSNGSPLAAIATGSKFNCALFGDGTVDCWGGPPINQQSPKTVSAPGSTVAISAGANHACEVSVIGLVSCWGDNSRGQIGNNSTGSFAPGTAVSGITDAVSVSAGAFSTCVVHADGTASCWGANDSGELSTVDSADHLTPSPVGNYRFCLSLSCPSSRVFAPLQGVAEMAVGKSLSAPTQQQACALLASGVIDCWGNNAQGEVGDGTTINRAIPTAVNSFAANVDPAATLRNGRIAEVTALIDCESGGEAHILLTLEQGGITGYGQAEARCTGRLLRVPMSIPARGPSGFQPGAATAQVEAIVRDDDRLLEDTHWTRQVTLSISQ
jgi:alpha-tubulin suppressor-like RCC1 family protein